MGKIWVVRYIKRDELVVAKQMPVGGSFTDKYGLKREAVILPGLHHPNIVSQREVDTCFGQFCGIMPTQNEFSIKSGIKK